ncbi:Splicing factor-like protein [Parasponia andersonii]|uniref:Splicing factor-like protein n=1 Tax=Parasponia andersonii TaxID=3476 RepID=A0A2P5CCQ7_PARAD|nr:Splicing factor-like protein [Parasponia andersonii]
MPPLRAKRGAAAAGPRRTARATRGAQKAQNLPPPEAAEEPVQAEEVPAAKVEAKEEVKVEAKPVVEEKPVVVQKRPPVVEEKPVVVNRPVPDIKSESKLEPNGLRKEDKVKESVDEYEKDERLDLEDNEAEYETEEYGAVDYDEKEIDQEDIQEVGEEVEEENEENLDEEDEGDMVEEELEDVHEELEGEEYEEHVEEGQEHVGTVDAEEDDHHEVFKERRKRKEFEVFVGGLDKDASEGDLRKVFSSVGEVTEVRLMMNPQTKKNKGFAFLRFATVEQAKRAVTELKNPVINGKQCGVTPSQDSDTLFLGNICKTWTKEALKEKLKHYGVDDVEDLTLVEDSNNKGMNRGFAFLEFSSRSDAMDAFKRLQKRDIVFGVDRPAKVSFADSFIDPGDEIMAQVKTVFVDGLPATWDEDRVRALLKKYGEIVKIELARNMPSAKRKDFGFVTFDTHDAAVTCAKSINNAELGEGDNKAKVRARLSRPLQKGKGKHGGRGDFRTSRASGRVFRGSWGHPSPRSVPMRSVRGVGSRLPPTNMKRPLGVKDRRPVTSVPSRARPLPPPASSYDRRAPVSSYPKSSLKREYSRRNEIQPPRSRAVADYGSRVVQERRPSYRDDYSSRGPGYSDPHPPRSTSRTSSRRAYVDDGYSQRFDRPPPPLPSYREGRGRDYDSILGSKRPYSAVDDVPPRYTDAGVRQSRARLDYEYGASASQYGDAYGERLGRSNLGYGSSRTSQDSHGMYGSRQGMGYGGGSYGGGDVGGLYSSSYGGEYMPRGSDVGGGSYSSLYSGRGVGGSSYMGSGGSSSYY